jgi:chitin synthase
LQIVYVAIIGFVMLAAFLEWFLWLAAFLYCLVKVYQKAENWTVRVLAVLMMFIFSALRFVNRFLLDDQDSNLAAEQFSCRSWL